MFFFVFIFFERYDFIDVNLRFDFNDSLPNFYSFFWTNLWYLAVFFWFLFLIIFSFFFFRLNSFSFFLIYVYEITDFWSSNFSFFFCNFYSVNVNFLLTNDLNKYHPFIFYLSVLLLLLLVFYCFFYINFFFFKNSYFLLKKEFLQKIAFFCNHFALYLGSWWALQEGTWGGWWNWDASEVFGLFLLLFFVVQFHVKTHVFVFLKKKFFLLFFTFCFIFFYSLIQLNFDLVSHNFGIKFFFFFNNVFFLLESLLIIFFLFTKVFIEFFIRIFNFKILLKSDFLFLTNKLILSIFFVIILLSILFNSFLPLVHYFFWNFFELNIVNDLKHFSINKITFFIFILIFFFKTKIFLSNFFFYSYLFSNYQLVFASLTYFKFNFFFFIHFLFWMFIFINELSLNTQFLMFFFKSINLQSFYHNFFFEVFYVTEILDAFILQFVVFFKSFFLFLENSVNFKFLPLSFVTSNFLFLQNNLIFFNVLLFSNLNNFFLTFIEIQYLQFQTLLSVSVLFLLFFFQKTSYFFV